MDSLNDYTEAVNDFHQARNRAMLQELIARFQGKSTELLSYEEVLQKLPLQGSAEVGVQDIPLDSIVGSVNRYTDFTRGFLPRQSVDPSRWARVRAAASSMVGLPPIEVYKIGEVYFVKDGNHRVSVARELGATYIQAYVNEIRTRVPLTPDVRPDNLIMIAEYADFLEKTHLDSLRPQADLRVSVPGQYQNLFEHIDVHRYFMGLDERRDISYEEAVVHWYDSVYCPVVEAIRELGILRGFPGRTETDLYIWIAKHRATLEEELGWKINSQAAAIDLASQNDPPTGNLARRLGGRILDALDTLTLGILESGPPTGQWRREYSAIHGEQRPFVEILVPVSGSPAGWSALEQALLIAEREQAILHGLLVVPDEAEKESEAAQEVRAEFNRRCADAAVAGELAITTGEVAREIYTRARLADLVVANLAYPPAPQPLARLTSSWNEMIRLCPRPILAVPGVMTSLRRPLLAFDGSPKAEEALYAVTYLAGRWKTPVTVVTVKNGSGDASLILARALNYLESHGVTAEGKISNGLIAEAILSVADEQEKDYIVMGGYGQGRVKEIVLGSTVDHILRMSRKPMLICR